MRSFRPRDDAVARYEYEDEVVVGPAYHDGLDNVRHRDAAGPRGLGHTADRAVPDDTVGDTGGVESPDRRSSYSVSMHITHTLMQDVQDPPLFLYGSWVAR
jgi:hypothetical protein